MSWVDCERCTELVSTYALAAGDPGSTFPPTVVDYLGDFVTPCPVDDCPLCPLCDHAAAASIDALGSVASYLAALVQSLEDGTPLLCELCTHRAAHYALANGGTFDYLRALEQYLTGHDVGVLARYLTGDYVGGVQ